MRASGVVTFDGKRALVPGAGSGIGTAVARRLATEGAAVVLAELALAPAAELAGKLGAEAI